MKLQSIFVVMVLALIVLFQKPAQGTSYERENLQGIRKVKIIIEKVEPQGDLNEERVYKTVEHFIKSNGIEIADECLPEFGSDCVNLYVRITLQMSSMQANCDPDSNVYVAFVDIQAFQYLWEEGNKRTYHVKLWSTGTLFVAAYYSMNKQIFDRIDGVIEDILKDFAIDYFAANAK